MYYSLNELYEFWNFLWGLIGAVVVAELIRDEVAYLLERSGKNDSKSKRRLHRHAVDRKHVENV